MTTTDVEQILRNTPQLPFIYLRDIVNTEGIVFIFKIYLVAAQLICFQYYYYIRGLKQSLVDEKTLEKIAVNGDPMHEGCLAHRIPRAWEQQG